LKRALAAILPLFIAAACRSPAANRGSITLSLPYELDSLDPHARNSITYFAIASQFYEPLVSTDADMQIMPCLAQRWDNPDLSTWIFHLRQGVRFHDGRPLRAEDVVYSFERLLKNPNLEIAGYLLYIAEVKALDSSTVRIRTTRPLAVLLNKLRFIAIVPFGSTSAGLANHENGTGPYRLVGWVKNRSVGMERNPDYWGPPPSVERCEILLNRDPDAAVADLLTGRSQLIQCNSRRSARRISGRSRFELLRRPSIFVKYMSYDLFRKNTPYCSVRPNPFLDSRVREAIDIGVDRSRLVAELPAFAVPAHELVPPFVFGYDPRRPPAVHDAARARRLLADAGYPDGFAATLHVRKILQDAARIVAAQLAPLGIRLDVVALPDPEFLVRLGRRDTTLHLSRFGCLTGDISDILDNTLHSIDRARHFGIHNFNGFSDPRIDREIEESASIQGVARRREALLAISDQILDARVWIPLYIDEDVYAMDRRFSWRPRNDSMVLAAEIHPSD